MKSQLQLFLYSFFVFGTLIFANKGFSQINYSENFNVPANVLWTATANSFSFSTVVPCEGARSPRVNLFYDDFFGEGLTNAQIGSPSIGISNGGQATLTFQYKILNYSSTPSVPTPNSQDWGIIKIYYATAATGPFIEIGQINPTNHVESATCAVKTVSFFPPLGSDVFIRIGTELTNLSSDFFFYMDDVLVTQTAPIVCTGTPAASAAKAQKTNLCNGTAASLSLNPVYTATGYTYQWQKSTDGVAYTDIAGATAATLSNPQTVNTWYKAIVTCTGSGLSVTSTPVQVLNSGLPCLCEVSFAGDTEPITRVQFAGINNVSAATLNGSPDTEDFTHIAPAQVTAGNTYPITLQGNTGGAWTDHFKVYIDFNHNGVLTDPGESFVIGTITNSSGTDAIQAIGNIAIPLNATGGLTYMRVFKLYLSSPTDPCATGVPDDQSFGQVEDYLINITPSCTTAAPTAASTQSFCAGATVDDLQTTGTAVKWFLDANVGSPLGAGIPLVNGTVYYATQTVGCESLTRTAVTVTINNVTVDNVSDVIACSNYVLPALVSGDYYTAPDGGGTMLAAGDVIEETTILYVYKQVGTTTICKAEKNFVVTINNVLVDDVQDVTTCSDYVLPALENGAYYTAAAGGGTMLEAGSIISENTTIYVYAVSDVNPACTAEDSFTVTISEVTVTDMDDVTTCFEYVLPVLENGTYHTATAGGGTVLAAGTVITANTTVYVYVVSDANPACTAESSFVITINAPAAPSGDDTISDTTGTLKLSEIELEATGTITWYASEDDAEAGENPISENTVVPTGSTTYYATQTIGECESEPFAVTVDVVLGGKDFDLASFRYYPNPVNDVLNVSYSKTLTAITVFNLLGQEVIAKTINQNDAQIDLSQLAAGTYMVKVQSEDAFKVIKVVKK